MMKSIQLLTVSLAVATAFFTPTTRLAVKPTGTCVGSVCLSMPWRSLCACLERMPATANFFVDSFAPRALCAFLTIEAPAIITSLPNPPIHATIIDGPRLTHH